MADIFVSYARKDQERVVTIVELLESQGWSVFWDRTIPPGKSWRNYIGKALEDARCVVVLWTHHSIASKWVIQEADDALHRDIFT